VPARMKVEGKTAKPSKSKATKRSHEKAIFWPFQHKGLADKGHHSSPCVVSGGYKLHPWEGSKKKKKKTGDGLVFVCLLLP